MKRRVNMLVLGFGLLVVLFVLVLLLAAGSQNDVGSAGGGRSAVASERGSATNIVDNSKTNFVARPGVCIQTADPNQLLKEITKLQEQLRNYKSVEYKAEEARRYLSKDYFDEPLMNRMTTEQLLFESIQLITFEEQKLTREGEIFGDGNLLDRRIPMLSLLGERVKSQPQYQEMYRMLLKRWQRHFAACGLVKSFGKKGFLCSSQKKSIEEVNRLLKEI